MDVLTIKTFKPAEEVEDDLPTLLSLNEDLKLQKDKHAKKPLPQDDDLEPLDEDDLQNGLPWDEKETDDDDNDDGNDEEPSPDELEDEEVPDDFDLNELDLEEEPPAPPEPPAPAKGKKNKR